MSGVYVLVFFLFSFLALRNVAVKTAIKKLSVETTLILVLTFNALLALILYLFVFDTKKINNNISELFGKRDPILLLPIFASIVGLGFSYMYYRIVEVKKLYFISLILSVFPVFVAIAAYFLLNETMNLTQILAMLIVVTGVLMLNLSRDD